MLIGTGLFPILALYTFKVIQGEYIKAYPKVCIQDFQSWSRGLFNGLLADTN